MRYRFGEVELDTETYELRSADGPVDVEPQVFDVLVHLLAHRARVVPKEELLDIVWGDRFVSESALTTRIKQARQAVGDNGQAQRVIKTVHGRGYRLVADVDELFAVPVPVASDAAAAGSGGVDEGDAPFEPVPPTHYVVNDGASIAYQVFGSGPNLVLIEGYTTNVEVQWEHPAIARFLRRLGSFCRVAVLDKRGTGLSERLSRGEAPPLEQRADDVRAVMDAAGMRRATVFGSSEGGSLSVLLAAAHPDRVERLILHGTWARHPWLDQPERPEFGAVERRWGTGWALTQLADSMAGTLAGRRFLARFERQAATPGTARRLVELMSAIDVTALLPTIRVPTLVVHRSHDAFYGIEHARDLVAGIPDTRFLELPGTDHFLFSGDTAPILAAVEEFVIGTAPVVPSSDRFLATVLVCRYRRVDRFRPGCSMTSRPPRVGALSGTTASWSASRATDCSPRSTAPGGACGPPPTCATRWPRWASTSGSAYTRPRWSGGATTSPVSGSTSPAGWRSWPNPARSGCRAR